MIKVFCGSDPILLENEVLKAARVLVNQSGAVLERFDLKEASLSEVWEAVGSQSLFADARVIAVFNLQALKEKDLSSLIEEARSSPNHLLGAFVGAKAPRAVEQAGVEVVPTDPPSRQSARLNWLKSRARAASLSLEEEALELILAHLGEELARADSLFEVLKAAFSNSQKKISKEEVMPYLGDPGEVSVFKVLDAIDQGDSKKALLLLQRSNLDRSSAIRFLGLLFNAYWPAYLVCRSGPRALEDASDFAKKKALERASRMGEQALSRAVELVAKADLDLKGKTALDPAVTLEILVARLCQLSRLGARLFSRS